jgi:uncharacterized LabA/DUF88 family protein
MITQIGALFVDFENVLYALTEEPLHLARGEALSISLDVLHGLRSHLRDEGLSLVIERSYADWERMPQSAQRQLQIAGVLPKFVDGRIGKSTADIEMSLDILQSTLTRPEMLYVILVGGDRDYLPILRRLKEHGRNIKVCALLHTLSGDVREFIRHYAQAEVIELDQWLPEKEVPKARISGFIPLKTKQKKPEPESITETAPPPAAPPPAPCNGRKPILEINEWHHRCISAMIRFLTENNYREIHLGPFFRWFHTLSEYPMWSTQDRRKNFDELKTFGIIEVEEREAAEGGFGYGVAFLNWDHPAVKEVGER